MPIQKNFDPEKAVEIILYIANRAQIPDIYQVLKVIYFADIKHLHEYGRFMNGDRYIAMEKGPVPSGAYDIVKNVRGDGIYDCDHAKASFQIGGDNKYKILPFRDADLDIFSKSEIKFLDESIDKYGGMTFGQLKKISHDNAYNTADINDDISVEEIAKMRENNELLLDYLSSPVPD